MSKGAVAVVTMWSTIAAYGVGLWLIPKITIATGMFTLFIYISFWLYERENRR